MPTTTIEAPAAPATETATAVSDSPARSTQASDASRPAGPENMSGADLRAAFARNRQARRSASSAAASNQGTTAKTETPATSGSASTPGADQGAGPDSSNATSASAEEAQTVTDLATPEGDAATPEPETATPAATAEGGAVEPDLETLLDDPESASEEDIKAVKDKGIRRLLMRVNKLTARLKEAERTQQESASPREPAPQEGPTAQADPQMAQLDAKIAQIVDVMEWARANRDGGEYKNPNGELVGEYTADQVEHILTNGTTRLAELSARRAVREEAVQNQVRQQREQAMQQARTAYPWMADTKSEEYALASQLVRGAPYLLQHPEAPMWLADAIAGRKARLAASTQAKPATPRPTPPKVPPPAGAAAPRVDPAAKSLAEAEAAYEKSGKSEDLKRVLTLRRSLTRR